MNKIWKGPNQGDLKEKHYGVTFVYPTKRIVIGHENAEGKTCKKN